MNDHINFRDRPPKVTWIDWFWGAVLVGLILLELFWRV